MPQLEGYRRADIRARLKSENISPTEQTPLLVYAIYARIFHYCSQPSPSPTAAATQPFSYGINAPTLSSGASSQTRFIEMILVANGLQNGIYICFQNHSAHYYFIQNIMHPIALEDDIEFTYVLEALVQCLDKHLDQVQYAQITLLRIDRKDKVQRGVVPIDDLGFLPTPVCFLQVVAERVGTVDHLLVHPADDGLLLLVRNGLIKLGQAGLAVVVDD